MLVVETSDEVEDGRIVVELTKGRVDVEAALQL